MCYWVRIILFVIVSCVNGYVRMCLMCYWVRTILFVIDKDVSLFVIDKDVLLGTDHPFCY